MSVGGCVFRDTKVDGAEDSLPYSDLIKYELLKEE